MKRREFITLIGGAAAWPLTARGQEAVRPRRIAFVSGRLRPSSIKDSPVAGFPDGMRALGWVEGRDFVIEWRFAEGEYERLPAIVTEIVQSNVDVIVLATTQAIRAAQLATTTIPVVLGYSVDPVGNGFVASLARPGANITGLASSADDTSPKQLELLSTVVPGLSRVGVLVNPGNVNNRAMLEGMQLAAGKSGLMVIPVEAKAANELNSAVDALARHPVGGLMFVPDALFNSHLELIARLAMHRALPSVYSQREYAEAGGLMSYGQSLREFYRRAAAFVDKILKGARPGDLPIEQPTKFNLTINRRTADALGISIPSHLLIFADEVIE
jgi:putative tryptophan/tyrosine transport system substrate-binding protein